MIKEPKQPREEHDKDKRLQSVQELLRGLYSLQIMVRSQNVSHGLSINLALQMNTASPKSRADLAESLHWNGYLLPGDLYGLDAGNDSQACDSLN